VTGVTDRPLVSVIIIFLNAGSFLGEAIESVLAQTWDAWELLLIDDGSDDGSTKLAKAYSERWPDKVFYLEHDGHQNRGKTSSRNLGLSKSRGQYVAFLDADDVWLPGKLEQQVAILEAHHEVGMAYGPAHYWFSWTGDPADEQRDFVSELGVQPDTIVRPPTLLSLFLRREGVSPCPSSILVRRAVIERTGPFPEVFRGTYDIYEDQAFYAKIALRVPVFVANACWHRYRQHPEASTARVAKAGGYRDARLFYLSWLARYLSEQGVTDAAIWKAVRRERLRLRVPDLGPVWRHGWRLAEHAAGLLAPANGRHDAPSDPRAEGQAAASRGCVERVRASLREHLPPAARARLNSLYPAVAARLARVPSLPVLRQVRCIQLRRLRPLGNGRQQGTAIVRHYWAEFLDRHRRDIRGRALEVGTTTTIRRYGGTGLSQADAIDMAAHSSEVTVVADLSRADGVPGDQYDSFVNQFTLHLIYDVEAALYHSIRLLKPGGVLLANFPCVDYYFPTGLDMGTGTPLFVYWWFTPIQVETLLRSIGLDSADYTIELTGNLFARVAYQMNMAAEELTRDELDFRDPGHPLLICVRAVKPQEWRARKPDYREPWVPPVRPARWNPVTGHYAS